MYIKFKNSEKKIESIKSISNNIAKIITAEQPNLTGFQVFTDNGDLLGDYSDFTTLYKQESDGYMLSNDGSVYKEEILESYKPTLEEVKNNKLQELSNQCQQIIYDGFDVNYIDGKKHFSLTVQDQLNLISIKEKISEGEIQFEYHADGEPYKYFSKDEMLEIIETAEAFKDYHRVYCNNLMQYVKSLNTVEKVEKVKYGDKIPTKFQSEILKEQSMLM